MSTRKVAKGQETKARNTQFYFYPSQGVQPKTFVRSLKPDEKKRMTDLAALALKPDEKKRMTDLAALASNAKSTLEKSGLKKWEVTLEGYLEASSGALPGGKAGFKAAITFGSG